MFVVQLSCWATILDLSPHWIVECHLALSQIGSAVYIETGKITQFDPNATVGAIAVWLLEQTTRAFAELAFLRVSIPSPNQ